MTFSQKTIIETQKWLVLANWWNFQKLFKIKSQKPFRTPRHGWEMQSFGVWSLNFTIPWGFSGSIFGHFRRENDRKMRLWWIWLNWGVPNFPTCWLWRCLSPNLAPQGLTQNCDEFSNSKTFELVQSQRFWKFLLFEQTLGCFCVLTGVDMFWTPQNQREIGYLPHSSRIPPNVLRFIMDPMAKHHGNHGDHGAVDPYSLEGLVQRHENRQLLLQRLSSVRQQIKDLEREVPEMLSVYGQI